MYTPPFEITSRIIELISVVSEKIGEIQYLQDSAQHIQLRKENRIKTIHASLAIENNSLSIEQITAIIEGKRILGNPNEIKEVENSIQAYDLLLSLDPCSEKDLLKAHALMMRDLVGRSGKYRTDGVGIFDGETVVHLAPPAERVPALMSDLFAWLKASDVHPLVKSCVFHYEFEFIHPFQDGNGRMGRLWQTAILKDWKAIFAWLPVETLVKEHQKEYYDALGASDRDANSTGFIEFMLSVIAGTIEDIIEAEKKVTASVTQNVTAKVTQKVTAKVTPKVTVNVTANQQKIIDAIKANPFVTQDELVVIVGIARKNIIVNMKKLQESGLIKRIGADKNGHWQAGE